MWIVIHFKKFFIDLERGRGREGGERDRKRNISLWFPLLMHSLVDSCMCPDWGWNLQPDVLGQSFNQLSYWPGPVTHFKLFS